MICWNWKRIHIMVYWCHTTHIKWLSVLMNLLQARIILVYWITIHWSGVWNEYCSSIAANETHCFDINICLNIFYNRQFNHRVIMYFCQATQCCIPDHTYIECTEWKKYISWGKACMCYKWCEPSFHWEILTHQNLQIFILFVRYITTFCRRRCEELAV